MIVPPALLIGLNMTSALPLLPDGPSSPHPRALPVDKVFVINLARKPDRLRRMRERLARVALDSCVEVTPAVDGHRIDAAWLNGQGVSLYPHWNEPGSSVFYHARELKLGEVGCALSHWAVWSRIVEQDLDVALVLEDDAVLAPSTVEVLEQELATLDLQHPAWDLCYVGRKRMLIAPFAELPAPPEPRVSERLVRPSFSYGMHAYLLSRWGARKLLASGMCRALIPVDELVPALYCQHPRADIRTLVAEAPALEAFAIDPGLAVQAGEGSDTEASAFVASETPPEPARGERLRYAAIARVLSGEDRAAVARESGLDERDLEELCDAFMARARVPPPGPTLSLASLMGIDSPDEFLSGAFPDDVAVAHGDVGRLGLPAELSDVRQLVKKRGLRFSVFGKRGFRVGVNSPGDALAFYDRGETLYIVGLDRAFPGLATACRRLASDLGVDPRYVHVEGFASPPGAGASMHYDFDVNFNVQIEGEKTWTIAPNEEVENPLRSHHAKRGVVGVGPFGGRPLPSKMPSNAATHRAVPGSVVFLPRGIWHETVVHSRSFAIAFVVKPPTVAKLLLAELEGRLRQRAEWRAYALGRHRRQLVARALETLPSLVREIEADELLFEIVRARWATGTRRKLKALRRPKHGEHWSLEVSCPRGELEYPLAAALVPVARWLTAREDVFSTEELTAACRETSPALARRIVSYLIETGALERA